VKIRKFVGFLLLFCFQGTNEDNINMHLRERDGKG
jgi:hypothetical protein